MTEAMKSGNSIGPYCTINNANTENIPGYYECGGHRLAIPSQGSVRVRRAIKTRTAPALRMQMISS